MPYGCRHGRLPISILYICRKFHDEATDILYGENTFALASHDPWTLQRFSQLSHRAFAAIRFLHVFAMNSRSAVSSTSAKRCEYFVRCEKMWQDVCMLLSMHCTPFQLDLGFECYVKDLHTAKIVLASLKQLPSVRNLRLKLGNRRTFPDSSKEAMSRLLKSTVEDLTRTPPTVQTDKRISDASFPFLKLPVELQMMVLSHTGLVFTNGVERFHHISTDVRGIRLAGRGMTDAMLNGCCWACNISMPYTSMPCCKCICNREDRVQYSSTCVCNRNAAALFTVNRHISALAVETFYGRNQFYIRDSAVKRIWETFTKIPQNHLRHIRSLLIDGYGVSEEEDHGQWLLLISNIQRQARHDLHIKMIFTGQFYGDIFGLPALCETLASREVSRVSVLVDAQLYVGSLETEINYSDPDCDDGESWNFSHWYQGRRHTDGGKSQTDLEIFDLKWGKWREARVESIYGPPKTIGWSP
ncbi:uncharacterized protein BDZ99DRAFT_79698 [Mytilinidion resinicola]|uniref:Uncharacterized protein n=1 Tax=Mytilinidion resinicola TaxID=574789 RepID=A0A6A6YHN1_9PEZI|nr:uncharacterized protein BDZ99DRAFT_79698 [Mytilinidion resinicola]KAF2807407.1 hypothetical protein BDZ99DRAFT_79698 [Mytilinidion resinicola]